MEIDRSNVRLFAPGALHNQDAVDPARGQFKEKRDQSQVDQVSKAPDNNKRAITELDTSLTTSLHKALSQSKTTVNQQNPNILGGKAKQALHAYIAQQNQPSREEQDMISSLLGVDYYI